MTKVPPPQIRLPDSSTLARRPELQLLAVAVQRIDQQLALGENALQTKVELSFELAQPFGNVGEGGASRDTTDTIVGIKVSRALQQRRARGELAAIRARREAVQASRQFATERISVEVANLITELRAATDLLVLASEEVVQAEVMRNAERQRFANGASDFFLVNIREESAADARVQFFQAELNRHVSDARLAAATMNLPALALGAPDTAP